MLQRVDVIFGHLDDDLVGFLSSLISRVPSFGVGAFAFRTAIACRRIYSNT